MPGIRIERGKLPPLTGAPAAGPWSMAEIGAGAGLQADRGELVEPLGEELLVDLQIVGAGAGKSGQHRYRGGGAEQHGGAQPAYFHHDPPVQKPNQS